MGKNEDHLRISLRPRLLWRPSRA